MNKVNTGDENSFSHKDKPVRKQGQTNRFPLQEDPFSEVNPGDYELWLMEDSKTKDPSF